MQRDFRHFGIPNFKLIIIIIIDPILNINRYFASIRELSVGCDLLL